MSDAAVVAGAASGAASGASGARRPVGFAAELALLLVPSAHLVYLPVGGAMATAADLVVVLLLLVWGVELAMGGSGRVRPRHLAGRLESGLPAPGFLRGMGLLVVFGAYVALSGLWGFHDQYALAKGLGTVGLALAAVAVATSGLDWERAVDAWLWGTALALGVSVVLAVVGPDYLQARLIYDLGGILGLPFARLSGPLLHPNMLGDYLVVSGVLLWARWTGLSPRGGVWAGLLAVAMALALFLSAATAWVSAGIAAVWLARWSGREAREDGEGRPAWVPWVRWTGALGAAATLVALVIPLDLSLGPLELTTNGIRPGIWSSAAGAVLAAPVLGVGAAPYLAEAVDPFTGGDSVLWDAHNAYLSVLGQFGLVGAGLLAAGLAGALRGAFAHVADERVRVGLVVALVAVAVNGVFLASEDLRHVWLLLGLCGVAGRVGGEAEDGAHPAVPDASSDSAR